MNQSNFGTLNWQDLAKGLITAGVTGALDAVIQDLISGKLNWQQKV